MAKILFVLTSHSQKGDTGEPTGFHLSEMTHPYQVITEAGHQIDIASIQGGKAPIDGDSLNLKDPINKAFMEDLKKKALIENTLKIDDVNPESYQAIYFPGGHGTMWDFPNNEQLIKLIATIYEKGGIVGGVCHGPAALVNVKLSNGEYLVAGKGISCFTDEEERAVKCENVVPFLLETVLKERGAKHTKADNFQKHVVMSERLVTGQNPASATGVGEGMAQCLELMGG